MRDPLALRTLAVDVERDVEALGRVCDEAREVLKRYAAEEPSDLERRIPASVIHDYYTGVEAALERVVTTVNGDYPVGGESHQRLLAVMTLDIPDVRPPVITEGTRRDLDELRRLRHYFRHAYGAQLEWEALRRHVERIVELHDRLMGELDAFLAFLRRLASDLEAGDG